MLISLRTFLGISLAGVSLLFTNPASSQTPSGTGEPDYYEMTTYFEVRPTNKDYVDYVSLGNDQFLVGAQVWDVPTNTFTWADRSPSISVSLLQGYAPSNGIRLGDSLNGTLFNVGRSVLWWDGKNRRIAAELLLNGEHLSDFLSLGTHYALLCLFDDNPKTSSYYGKVVRLQQADEKSSLVWEMSNNPEVRSALLAAKVVGSVKGFDEVLTEADIKHPAYYDANKCRWQAKNPRSFPFADIPYSGKEFNDPPPDFSLNDYTMIPHFLSDGQTLLDVAINNLPRPHLPLLWQEKSHSWVAIKHTVGDDNHLAGQYKPLMYRSFQPKIYEFLDANTMNWHRFKQRLPSSGYYSIHPLSNGDALVFIRGGEVGIISPKFNPPLGKLSLTRAGHYEGEVVLKGGDLMLIGGKDSSNQQSNRSEIIRVEKGQSQLTASIPTPLVSSFGLELKDGSVLVLGDLPITCHPAYYPNQPLTCLTSFRYFPQENRWQALPNLAIPVIRGFSWQSDYSPRNDFLARRNGDVVWIEGDDVFDSEKEKLPQTSSLMRWQESAQNQSSKIASRLRKARRQSTILELDDGRVVVIGGFAQLERVALKKECFFDCPDEFVSIGPFQAARSTEILDESNVTTPVWQVGPLAHYGGGRALKLANGRIFKLTPDCRAEIADTGFTRWDELPPCHLTGTTIRNLSVVGNKVIILTNKNQTVAWDDDAKTWLIWTEWPKRVGIGDNQPISITALADTKRVLIRYSNSFEIVELP